MSQLTPALRTLLVAVVTAVLVYLGASRATNCVPPGVAPVVPDARGLILPHGEPWGGVIMG